MIDGWVIGTHRSCSGPKIPVQCLWRRLLSCRTRPGKSVGFRCTGSVRAEVHAFDFTDIAFLDPLDSGAVALAGRMLRAQLADYPRFDGSFCQSSTLRHVLAHRLLAIDMLAHLDCAESDGKMIVVGDTDIDGVKVFRLIFQQLPPVSVLASVRDKFGCGLEPFLIDVADSDNFNVWMSDKALQVMAAH